ncbi:MAG: shikimate dehydrogenase [Chloroflexi bacterium]|jgi:shikimate dehydrogenase|nr:shikimate dehydrogenase [Chloroflexota bacterium]
MKQTVGLIGYPLGHSISPVFQQAAFDKMGLDIRYELWETPPEKLSDVVNDIRSSDKSGANVTVPYKENVIPMLDELNEVAAGIGAVNTIVKKDEKLVGYNTDAEGFIRALEVEGKFDPDGKTVTMIGAGGVARAIGFALIQSGIKSLELFDIDMARAEKLAAELGAADVRVLSSNEGSQFESAVSGADLLINCTPIGMKHSPSENVSPVAQELISVNSLVYDVVYNPVKTRLLQLAEEKGARTLGGLSMLVYQGVASFELWTEKMAPVDIMMDKAVNAL